MRAIVTNPSGPMARYLDGSLVSARPQKQAHVDGSRIIAKPGDIGSSVACRDGKRWLRGVVVAGQQRRMLTVGYAGRLRAHADAQCVRLALQPALKPGDRIWVARHDVYGLATVDKVDQANGVVAFTGGSGSGVAALLDVAPNAKLTADAEP